MKINDVSRTIVLLAAVCLCAAHAAEPRVGLEVREALSREASVRVMIALKSEVEPRAGLPALTAEVARVQDRVLAALTGDDFELARRFGAVPSLAGRLSASGLAKLEDHPDVLRIDLDAPGAGNLAQATALTGANTVAALGFTGAGTTVAVIDSGVDRDHADLQASLVGEACFCSGGGGCCPGGGSFRQGAGAAEDDNGHGSNVAGIVTADGVVIGPGAARDAEIVAIKVLDSGNSFCCSSDVVAGLDWILLNRPDVDVVNMSLGTAAMFAGDCDNATSFTISYANAVDALTAQGIPVFVSSGNNGSGTQMQAPACVANAISVGAVWDADVGSQNVFCFEPTTAADQVTCFSNASATTDIFAPGAPVTSAFLSNSTATYYGTSQASPHAAGCAAAFLEAVPTLSPATIEAVLETTGVSVIDATNGLSYPRIDCDAALDQIVCLDEDKDGFPANALCPGATPADCDDGNGATFPGGSEINDGEDNQCDGEGFGLVDETGTDSFFPSSTRYEWPPQPATLFYQIARSSSPTFIDCTLFSRPDPWLDDAESPAAGALFHYLNRSASPFIGSWGLATAGERTFGCSP